MIARRRLQRRHHTFVEQARADESITVNDEGGQMRDFVHVDDIVRANLAAATTDTVGAAYNVGTGSTRSIADLAEEIRAAAGSDSLLVCFDHNR